MKEKVMVARIVSERRRAEEEHRELNFYLIGDESRAGYSFDADENWKPVFGNDLQKKNYEMCMNSNDYEGPFKETWTSSYMEPATLQCECGEKFSLVDQYLGACECPKCGRWYNLFGTRLLPPSEWGLENDDPDDAVGW